MISANPLLRQMLLPQTLLFQPPDVHGPMGDKFREPTDIIAVQPTGVSQIYRVNLL